MDAKKVVYVDMDGVVADFDKCRPNWPSGWENWTDDEFDNFLDCNEFFYNLELIEGAADGLAWLDRHFKVRFLSTAPWGAPNGWKDKRRWIERHFPNFLKRLILTHDKDLQIGDYLIDDRLKNGAAHFRGCLILFGSPEFPNWKAVIEFLKKKEGIND